MRKLYDSITAADIPADVQMVGGYVDGSFKWTDADWELFPNAVKVRIAVLPTTNDGHVGDVEAGDMTPAQSPEWVKMRRSSGVDPSLYVNLGNVQAVRDAFAASGVIIPPLWLAHYDNDPTIPPGYIAKQYANSTLTGGHYDVSSVADYWPGVDRMPVPQRIGQSADLDLKVGEVGMVQAIYHWPDGRRRAIVRKVWSHTTGRFIFTVLPPVDPDADETIHLDAEPTYFVVDVLP